VREREITIRSFISHIFVFLLKNRTDTRKRFKKQSVQELINGIEGRRIIHMRGIEGRKIKG